MGAFEDGAWDVTADVNDPEPFAERDDEPIGSERRGFDMSAAIAAGVACEGCGAYPVACICNEPRDTIETPAPVLPCPFGRCDGSGYESTCVEPSAGLSGFETWPCACSKGSS